MVRERGSKRMAGEYDDAKIATREEFDMAFDERWNSGVKPATNSAENSEIMVKSPLAPVKNQGGNLKPFAPGVSGNPSGRRHVKAWKKVLKKLPAETMAEYFIQGLELAVFHKSPKLILEYSKVYYERSDGAVTPMLPEQASGFAAVIMALRGTEAPADEDE